MSQADPQLVDLPDDPITQIKDIDREWVRIRKGAAREPAEGRGRAKRRRHPEDQEHSALIAPRRFTAVAGRIPNLPPVTLGIAIRDSGAAYCTRLEIASDPGSSTSITTLLLREIPLKRLVSEAVAVASERIVRSADGGIARAPKRWIDEQYVLHSAPRRIGARSDEQLQEVAEVYRSVSKAPRKAVLDHLRRKLGSAAPSRATVSREIALAREKGFLDPL